LGWPRWTAKSGDWAAFCAGFEVGCFLQAKSDHSEEAGAEVVVCHCRGGLVESHFVTFARRARMLWGTFPACLWVMGTLEMRPTLGGATNAASAGGACLASVSGPTDSGEVWKLQSAPPQGDEQSSFPT